MMKHRHNEPTPEQRERMRAATEEAARIFLQMQEEMKTVYSNTHCPVCGHRIMTGFVCRLHRGVICENHCDPAGGKRCRYFQREFFQCLYREEERK
ncbi:hypothetical protein [Pectinatus frisingensis]|uniref:hypothetical protein n=1 Tax=Pectinatus frisingensis TaxID=865 RepID=UPI0018C48F8E|nr:hypothetical protein [Pectinatus frisingensis]